MSKDLALDPFELLAKLGQLDNSGLSELLGTTNGTTTGQATGENLYEYLSDALKDEERKSKRSQGPLQKDQTTTLLKQLQVAVATHPAAAKWIVTALRNEGRRYAASEEGAALAQELVTSELVQRARMVWENSTLWLLDDETSGALPSQYIDAIFAAASRDDLEPYLDRMFTRE